MRIAALSIFLLAACSDPMPPPEKIEAALLYLDGDLIFTNHEPFDLRKCLFVLDTAAGDVYRFHWDFPVAAGKGVPVIPADGFVNGNGERFDDRRYRPKQVIVECEDQSGKPYAGGITLR